jgi:gas vesicle protein
MEDHDYTSMSAFVAGALIGAGVALLLAPQSGAELRGMLRRYAYDARDEIYERGREAWDTAVERGKEYMDTGREKVREAGKTAREYMETGREAGREAIREAAKRV